MSTSAQRDAVYVLGVGKEDTEAHLILGAQASLQVVYEASACPDLLCRTLRGAVTWQRRNETTVEKTVLSPNLAPQWIAALLALDARVALCHEEQEERLADFVRRGDSHRSQLEEVRLPLNVVGRVWGEAHVARTPADEPIVAAIAVVDLTNGLVRRARLALTGVWRAHARLAESAELLVGGPLDDDRIRQVAAAVEREVTPRDDFRGSADYRRAMASVLTRRTLEACWRGANQP